MRLLNKINNNARQKFTLIGEAGERIDFLLYYMPSQQSWFFDMTYLNKTINGVRVVPSPNIIRNQKNIFSFGLCCQSSDGGEAFYLDDFLTGRIRLYLLNSAEVALIELEFFND